MKVSNRKLFFAMLRSRKAMGLNKDMVGFAIEDTVGPVTREDAMAYAQATNDENPVYAKNEALIPPLFLAKLVHPLLMQLMINRDLNMNILRMVHGQQSFRWVEPIEVGDTIEAKLLIEDLKETSAGELLELRFTASKGDKLCGEAKVGLMVRGKSSGAKKAKKEEPVKPEPVFTIEIPTTDDQALRYAEASGDKNFIHTSNFLAKMAGLPRTILHGMCALAMSTNSLAAQLADGDITRLDEISVRFASPSFPGQPLTIIGYPETEEGIPFEVQNIKGKAVLKNGLVKVKD